MKRLASILILLAFAGCVLPNIGGGGRGKAPFPSPEGLAVLVIKPSDPEALGKLSPTQADILNIQGKAYAWMSENCVKVGGLPERRMVSPTNKMELESAKWHAAVAVPRPGVPCVIAACKGGGMVAEIKPTDTPESFIKALQAVKGK